MTLPKPVQQPRFTDEQGWTPYPHAGPVREEHLYRFEQAQERGFLAYRNRATDADLYMAWENWCAEQRRPWIVVEMRRKFARVRMSACYCDERTPTADQEQAIEGLIRRFGARNIVSGRC